MTIEHISVVVGGGDVVVVVAALFTVHARKSLSVRIAQWVIYSV